MPDRAWRAFHLNWCYFLHQVLGCGGRDDLWQSSGSRDRRGGHAVCRAPDRRGVRGVSAGRVRRAGADPVTAGGSAHPLPVVARVLARRVIPRSGCISIRHSLSRATSTLRSADPHTVPSACGSSTPSLRLDVWCAVPEAGAACGQGIRARMRGAGLASERRELHTTHSRQGVDRRSSWCCFMRAAGRCQRCVRSVDDPRFALSGYALRMVEFHDRVAERPDVCRFSLLTMWWARTQLRVRRVNLIVRIRHFHDVGKPGLRVHREVLGLPDVRAVSRDYLVRQRGGGDALHASAASFHPWQVIDDGGGGAVRGFLLPFFGLLSRSAKVYLDRRSPCSPLIEQHRRHLAAAWYIEVYPSLYGRARACAVGYSVPEVGLPRLAFPRGRGCGSGYLAFHGRVPEDARSCSAA